VAEAAVSTADASTAVPAISADSADAETESPILPEPKAPKAPRKAPKKGARKGKAVKGKATKNKSRKANSKGSAPSTGQSAPPIVIHFNELTDRERKLLRYIDGDGEGLRPMVPIKDMVSVFYGAAGTKARANSWVRNQLRDLVRGSWIVKVDRGMYQVAESARKRIRAATAPDTTETAAE
jgi:hypothetical protein